MTNIQAINLLKDLEQSLDDYCELNDEGKTAFRMAITALEVFGNSEQLPSAQPEERTNKRTETHACDCISRQAAIDLWEQYHPYIATKACEYDAMLRQLPPAQPEQTYCDYCHEDSDGFVYPIEKNNHAVIHGSVLHLRAKGWSKKVQIKYCPICGRRLADG